jgi:hypothetical protein
MSEVKSVEQLQKVGCYCSLLLHHRFAFEVGQRRRAPLLVASAGPLSPLSFPRRWLTMRAKMIQQASGLHPWK